MSKSKEELKVIKEDVETVSKKLSELTPEEIAQVSGGVLSGFYKVELECSPE